MNAVEWFLVLVLAIVFGCWVHYAERKNRERRKAEQLFRSLDDRKWKDIE